MKTLDVTEANAIQAEWMKLDPFAPEPEKQRVFRLYDKIPSSYISQTPSGQAQLMIQGMPAHAFLESVEECEHRAKLAGVQTALRWCSNGTWIAKESEAHA